MKIVLLHKSTGRYYRAPQDWVRRSDNALAFEDLTEALEFLRAHHLGQTQTVYRLAPYLMPLLQEPPHSMWTSCPQTVLSRWYAVKSNLLDRN
jgi:hypothetical protein